MPAATTEVVTTPSVPKAYCPVPPEAFLGQWIASNGDNVLVVKAEENSRMLKAILTKPEGAKVAAKPKPGPWVCNCGFKNKSSNQVCGGSGPIGCKQPRPVQIGGKPLELPLEMDGPLRRWRCGNGVLDIDQLENDNDSNNMQPTSISWVSKKGQSSTWKREKSEKSWSDVVKNEGDSIDQVPVANGVKAEVFLGQWKDSLHNNINVTCDGDISKGGLLKASYTRQDDDDSTPKVWLITIDHIGNWRCGNGTLNDDIEYHKEDAVQLSWTVQDNRSPPRYPPRVSYWQRARDAATGSEYSSTDEGTEENLKETWWNMTEEWEGEKCALKAKITKEYNKAQNDKQQATQKKGMDVTHKTQRTPNTQKTTKHTSNSDSDTSRWMEVGKWKRENGRGGRRQQKAQH